MPREINIPDEWITELVGEYGLTENEAYVFALLLEAQKIYDKLPGPRANDEEFYTGVQAAQNVLAIRVVRRDHPDGWLTVEEREERGKD